MDPFSAIGLGLASSAGGTALGGLFGGNDVPKYEPSPLMSSLGQFAEQQIKPTKQTRKAIRAEAKTYASPGAKEAFLQQYAGLYSSPFIEKQLAKSYKKPIDFESDAYKDLASFAYGQQGLSMPSDAFQKYINVAKSTNVRSPEAFSDLVRQNMLASDLVRTPEDIAWERRYGNMQRGEDGRLARGMVTFDPAQARQIADTLLGKA